jgi:hypothetical protein
MTTETATAWVCPQCKGRGKFYVYFHHDQETTSNAEFDCPHDAIAAAALTPIAPLIEAARAYRDAIAEIRALPDWPLEMKAKYMIAVNEADHALHEAARTLEGHVEEGKTHGA